MTGFTFLHENGVGIHNVKSSAGNFKIYPNPASSRITVVADETGRELTVELVNAQGKTALTRVFSVQAELDMSHLPAGIYLWRIQENSGNRLLREGKVTLLKD